MRGKREWDDWKAERREEYRRWDEDVGRKEWFSFLFIIISALLSLTIHHFVSYEIHYSNDDRGNISLSLLHLHPHTCVYFSYVYSGNTAVAEHTEQNGMLEQERKRNRIGKRKPVIREDQRVNVNGNCLMKFMILFLHGFHLMAYALTLHLLLFIKHLYRFT